MESNKKNGYELPVIIIDKDYNIIDINQKAEEIYGNIKGDKCYRALNNYQSPCSEETSFVCPINVINQSGNSQYTGLYTFNRIPSEYVLVTAKKKGDLYVQKHRILSRNSFDIPDFKKILDFLAEGIVVLNERGKIKFVNKKFMEIFSITGDPDLFLDKDISYLKNRMPEGIREMFSKSDGIKSDEEYPVHYNNSYLIVKKTNLEGKYTLWSFLERKETDLSDEIFRVLLETTPVGIFLQCSGRFMYVNPTLASILETFPGNLIGSSIYNFVHPEDRKTVEMIAKKREIGERSTEKYIIRVITEKNKIKWVEITSETIIFRGKNCGIGSVVDITERKKLEEDLRRLATVDQLTGIYNRYSFEKFLEKEIERAERYGESFALIMFDIDNFKQINDIYGHQVGDKVLKEVVEVVRNHIRKSDIFARWGGEEFMILVPIKEKSDAYKIAEKIRKNIQNFNFDKIDRLTVSLGISFYKGGDSMKSMIRRADTALYEAKKTGKNRTVVAD